MGAASAAILHILLRLFLVKAFPLLTDAGWVSSLVADDQMCCKRVQLLPFCPGCVLLGLGIERRLCDDLPEQNLFPEHQLTREVG